MKKGNAMEGFVWKEALTEEYLYNICYMKLVQILIKLFFYVL